jgi:hypothetical protein
MKSLSKESHTQECSKEPYKSGDTVNAAQALPKDLAQTWQEETFL